MFTDIVLLTCFIIFVIVTLSSVSSQWSGVWPGVVRSPGYPATLSHFIGPRTNFIALVGLGGGQDELGHALLDSLPLREHGAHLAELNAVPGVNEERDGSHAKLQVLGFKGEEGDRKLLHEN